MGFKNYLNVYEFECELPGTGEKVKYKPITTNQIKKLLVYENETNPIIIEQAFDELIQSCIITDSINIDNIYDKDREFLLIQLRKVSKGEQYEYTWNCPKCKSGNLSYIDFNSFPLKSKKDTPLYEIDIMPNVSIFINHSLRKEQKEVYKCIPKNIPDERISKLMGLYTLAAGIKAIRTPDGTEDKLTPTDKIDIMDSLTVGVIDKMKDWYIKNTFGYDLTYTSKCDHCNFVSDKQTIEVNSNFF